jgi:hypothetical protein
MTDATRAGATTVRGRATLDRDVPAGRPSPQISPSGIVTIPAISHANQPEA